MPLCRQIKLYPLFLIAEPLYRLSPLSSLYFHFVQVPNARLRSGPASGPVSLALRICRLSSVAALRRSFVYITIFHLLYKIGKRL